MLSSDLGVTEQIRVIRRLLLEHVKAYAPLVDRLVVPSAPGNHDQPHRFGGIAPRGHDSWAVDAALQVADALHLAGGYEHVEIVTPDIDDLTVQPSALSEGIAAIGGDEVRSRRTLSLRSDPIRSDPIRSDPIRQRGHRAEAHGAPLRPQMALACRQRVRRAVHSP